LVIVEILCLFMANFCMPLCMGAAAAVVAVVVAAAAAAVVVVVAVAAAAAAAFNKTCCHKNSNPERNIAASMK
jgi:hypothetical protein